MLYDTPGETFISDPEYVADAVPCVVAASSQLPCPSCLTGLMETFDAPWLHMFDGLGDEYDGFACLKCKRRVLIERMPQ